MSTRICWLTYYTITGAFVHFSLTQAHNSRHIIQLLWVLCTVVYLISLKYDRGSEKIVSFSMKACLVKVNGMLKSQQFELKTHQFHHYIRLPIVCILWLASTTSVFYNFSFTLHFIKSTCWHLGTKTLHDHDKIIKRQPIFLNYSIANSSVSHLTLKTF